MVQVTVKVKPGAKRNTLSLLDNGLVAIAVTSPPVDGKANSHVLKILSKALRIPKSSLTIIRGEKSREKVVAIEGLAVQEIVKKIKGCDVR